ncbi:unnamed protein product, partial [Musa acuminata var. zebrina]
VKPRLGAFTAAPEEVGESILKLMDFAKERVLRVKWRMTKMKLICVWINSRFAKEQQSKKKRMQGDKAVTRSIPIDIVESVLMRMNPKDAVRLSTTCKNWRATAPRYDPTMSKIPWLLIIADDFYTLQSIIDENMSFKIEIPSFFRGRKFNGDASHGWLVLRSKQSDIVSLLNPFSRARLDLPALERPVDPDFELVTFQVLPLRVKKLDVPPPIDIDNLMAYDLTLVESCGKILLVCIHSSLFFTADRDNLKELNVMLFQLDLKNEIWIKMESLGDQTLFLKNKNNQTISISAPEAKCCGNSIYFINNWSRDVYFIEKHSIRTVSRGSYSINRRLWITPNLI